MRRQPFEAIAVVILPDHLHCIWQAPPDDQDFPIPEGGNFILYIDYIHFSPVKHGYVSDPNDWPYSTWHEGKNEFGGPINMPPSDWLPRHLGERV